MSQAAIFSVPVVGPASPSTMAARTDDSLRALLSGHSGASRPSYAVDGTFWVSTATPGQRKLYLYDGSDDILLMALDIASGAVIFSGLGAAIDGAVTKPVPVGADKLGLWDSVSGDARGLVLDDLATWLASITGQTKVSGCETVYVSTTTIQMKTGYVFFNGRRTTFAVALTKALNATFVAGGAGGMLDIGAMAASKTYFIHAVRNVATGAGDWVASLQSDPALVNMTNLTGWNVEGRVNVVLTTSGNVIRQYVQDGNEYRITTAVTELSAGSWAANDFQFTAIPAGISTEAYLVLINGQNPNSAGVVIVSTDTGTAILQLSVNVVSSHESRVSGRVRSRPTGVLRSQAAETVGSGSFAVLTTGFNDYTAPRPNGA
ncbi:hypothetical protein [Rhizobium leguminosarum]|uniref:hypothetical protein n=1 Tax=Rhizobium leguminosarum TaxID=384 RepID=UPI003F992CE4